MKTGIHIMLLAFAMVVLVGCRGKQPEQKAETQTLNTIAAQEAQTIIQQRGGQPNFVILDVRTPQEFAQGHLAGAVNLNFHAPTFRAQLEKFQKQHAYLVYCRSGNRSGKTLDMMRELGFAEAYNITGGIGAWAQKGLPISK